MRSIQIYYKGDFHFYVFHFSDICNSELVNTETFQFPFSGNFSLDRLFLCCRESQIPRALFVVVFFKKIPDALNVVREYRRRLLDGEVPVWDLVVTKRLSKDLEDYRQRVSQVIAGEQLVKEGFEVSAGKSVRFLFTSAKNKRYRRRVKAKELIEEGTNPDVRKYLLLLYSAASNILSPFGYSPKNVYDYVRGYQYTRLA